MAWKQTTGGTRHTCNEGFGPSFGRLTAGCARCDELTAGAPARTWAKSSDAMRCEEIKIHFASARHLNGGCGPVCTFGEW